MKMVTMKEQTSELPVVADVSIHELHFDRRNPRLFLEQDHSEDDLILRLWRDFAVDEVAMSIAHNGYFRHEPLFATTEDDQLVVVEGNRRLAAVRLLVSDELRKQVGATDLPPITSDRKTELEVLPVIERQRSDVWQYIGFKHVNGPQPWQSYAKAQYIAWVHNELGTSLDDIARKIGDRHATVRRLYRGLMVLRQAEEAKVFDLNNRWKKHFPFSHLYTGLDYPNIRNFLGINNDSSFGKYPVPDSHISNLGDLCQWLYGQKPTRPLVQAQNPDLRKLEEAIGNKDGLVALRRGLSLDIAVDISTGDEQLFRGHLLDARRRLQEARGKQLTGYQGDIDTLQIAKEIFELADHLVLDMENNRRTERRDGKHRVTSK